MKVMTDNKSVSYTSKKFVKLSQFFYFILVRTDSSVVIEIYYEYGIKIILCGKFNKKRKGENCALNDKEVMIILLYRIAFRIH